MTEGHYNVAGDEKPSKAYLAELESDHGVYTINEAIEELGFGLFQMKLTFVTGLAWMIDSIEVTLLALLAPRLRCYWELSSFQEAFITTCLFFGMAFGCSFWGMVCDRYGRRTGILCSLTLVLFNSFLSAASPSYHWILVSMFVTGFATGGVGQSVVLFSEFVPTKYRGSGIVFIQIFYVFGNIISGLLALFIMPAFGWRWFLIAAATPVLLFLTVAWWFPESPRFLLAAGRVKEAELMLQRVAKANSKVMPKGKLAPLKANSKRGTFTELFSSQFRRTTCLLWIIWFTNVFSYYGIMMLTTSLFKRGGTICLSQGAVTATNTTIHKAPCIELHKDDFADYILTVIGEFPGLLLTLILIETIGRKLAMVVEFFVAGTLIAVFMFCIRRVHAVVLMFFLRAFITGMFQVAYVYTPEVYPTRVRALALGSASSVSRLGAIITPFIAQVLVETNGQLAVMIYCGMIFVCIPAILLLPRETKGKVLQEEENSLLSEHQAKD